MTVEYDVPTGLAAQLAVCHRPLLIGLDIDGVLAPIVAHADDARLLDGIAEALESLSRVDGVVLAAVSGRALDSMRTFGLPDQVRLVGSHGMESADREIAPLTDAEQGRLDRLVELADDAVAAAGDGAWVEHKHASVAVHIREADADAGTTALARLADQVTDVDGASAKPGSAVLELFTRHASKGTAIAQLRAEQGAATTVFVGDDVTDEEAFAALGQSDVAIKVGDAVTIASRRLRDPEAVRELLTTLARLLNAPGTSGR